MVSESERGLATALFDSGSSIGGALAPFLVLGIYTLGMAPSIHRAGDAWDFVADIMAMALPSSRNSSIYFRTRTQHDLGRPAFDRIST
jgi:hypothetical protein